MLFSVKSGAIFAAVYALCVFLIGFGFGVFRTKIIAPKFGKFRGVALELPFILIAAWWVLSILSPNLPRDSNRILIGLASFLILLILEYFTAHYMFKMSLKKFAAKYKRPDGILGLLGQIIFALFVLFIP